MSEFTKGPWKITDTDWAKGYRIQAVVGNDETDVAQITNIPDARLIAAAPEMFALLAYVATYQCKHPQYPEQCPYCQARALIARIEPFGPNTHAGVWISKETADKISRDGP